MKNKFWKNLLKYFCYIMFPILFMVIFVSTLVMKENINRYEEDEFYESKVFAELNYDEIYWRLGVVSRTDLDNLYFPVVSTVSFEDEDYTMKVDTALDYSMVIIDRDEKIIYAYYDWDDAYYSNLRLVDLDTLVADIDDTDYKFHVHKDLVNNDFNDFDDAYFYDIVEDRDIEVMYGTNAGGYTSPYFIQSVWYEIVESTYHFAPLIIILAFILILIGIYYVLTVVSGKSKEELNLIDKIPYDLILYISGALIYIATNISYYFYYDYLSVMFYLGFIYTLILFLFETTVHRFSAQTLFTNTLIYKSFGVLKHLLNNTPIFVCLIGLFGLSIFGILFVTSSGPFTLFVFYVVWGLVAYYFYKKITTTYDIFDAIESIYDGEEVNLDLDKFKGEYNVIAYKINNISKGLNDAIEKQISSERMKTELITNVSHDIKTPLTSIINYVDLIKKEDVKNKKIKEYIDILDNKADRLKKLTDDLVEVSKATSGNLKINLEKINVSELINQLNGEYIEKFEKNNLEIECSGLKKNITISADSKYIYRVFDNIYSNVSKYAMNNSRVYIDVEVEEDEVIISMKNISKEKLNISKEELIQRFVRGDSSRSETGSGLGLSIVEGLIKLQNATFDIVIDGDLFKVVLKFKKR